MVVSKWYWTVFLSVIQIGIDYISLTVVPDFTFFIDKIETHKNKLVML